MVTIDEIREQIKALYTTNPHIHMDVNVQKPKTVLKGVEATIVGVYPFIFRIEERTTGKPKFYTMQYSDIITKNIIIAELNL